MKTDERRKQVLEMIQGGGKLRVSTIIDDSGFSPATVRRDITFLEENGYVQHSHGYVEYKKPEVVPTEEFSPEILKIASAAADLVGERDTIILDSGTTTFAMAYQLLEKKDLTVITNSIPVANLYSTAENIQTLLTGGYLRTREAALVGDDVINFCKRIRAQKLFLSTTGVRGIEGLTCVTTFQVNVKSAFIDAADEVILLIDSAKFDRDALRIFAPFEKINKIVTDKPIRSSGLKRHFDRLGIEVIVAD